MSLLVEVRFLSTAPPLKVVFGVIGFFALVPAPGGKVREGALQKDGLLDFHIVSRTHDAGRNSAMVDLRAQDEHGNEVVVVARFTFMPGPDQNAGQTDAEIERKARQALRDAAQFLRD